MKQTKQERLEQSVWAIKEALWERKHTRDVTHMIVDLLEDMILPDNETNPKETNK